jgi:hypothetical protein
MEQDSFSGFDDFDFGSDSGLPQQRDDDQLMDPFRQTDIDVAPPGGPLDWPNDNRNNTPEPPKKRSSGNGPISQGIARNVGANKERRLSIVRLLQTLFTGVPYATDNYVLNFQVFSNSGSSSCDQVMLYGKTNSHVINDYNEVEVYGRRDSRNVIIARKIINRSSGMVIRPQNAVPAFLIRLAALIVLAISIAIVSAYGAEGIVIALVMILCLLNLPLVMKILWWMIKTLFRILRMVG